MAVLGHCYSIWLLGRGGKGIAPALGVLFAVNPLLLAIAGGFFGLAFLLTRSLYRGVLLAALAFPVAASAVGGGLAFLWFGFGVGIPIALKHLADWNRPSGSLPPNATSKSKPKSR